MLELVFKRPEWRYFCLTLDRSIYAEQLIKLIGFYNDKQHSYAESRRFQVLKVGKPKENGDQ